MNKQKIDENGTLLTKPPSTWGPPWVPLGLGPRRMNQIVIWPKGYTWFSHPIVHFILKVAVRCMAILRCCSHLQL